MSKFNEVFKTIISEGTEAGESWKMALGDVVADANISKSTKLAEALEEYIIKFPRTYAGSKLLRELCDIVWEAADAYIPGQAIEAGIIEEGKDTDKFGIATGKKN